MEIEEEQQWHAMTTQTIARIDELEAEVAERKQMVETLYDAQPDLFPDLRNLETVPVLQQRVRALALELCGRTPMRTAEQAHKMRLEKLLVKHKLTLYQYGPLPRRRLNLLAPFLAVRNTDYSVARQLRRIGGRDAPREKRVQTLILLHTMMTDKNLPQMRQMLARMQTL